MVNISSPFKPSPLREGGRRTATVTSVEVVREIKTAFIPYGTNAVRIRGATRLRPFQQKIPLVMQREPASLFSSTTIWFML